MHFQDFHNATRGRMVWRPFIPSTIKSQLRIDLAIKEEKNVQGECSICLRCSEKCFPCELTSSFLSLPDTVAQMKSTSCRHLCI